MLTREELNKMVEELGQVGTQEDLDTALAALRLVRPLSNPPIIRKTDPIEEKTVKIPWEDYEIGPLSIPTKVEIRKMISREDLYAVSKVISWETIEEPEEDEKTLKDVLLSVRVPCKATITGVTILNREEFEKYREFIPNSGYEKWFLRDSDRHICQRKELSKEEWPEKRTMLRPVIRFSVSLQEPSVIGSSMKVGNEEFTIIDQGIAIKTSCIQNRYWNSECMSQMGYEGSGLRRFVDCWIRYVSDSRPQKEKEGLYDPYSAGKTIEAAPGRDIFPEKIRLLSFTEFRKYCGLIPPADRKWMIGDMVFTSYYGSKTMVTPAGNTGDYFDKNQALRPAICYQSRDGFQAVPGDRIIINGHPLIVLSDGLAISEQASLAFERISGQGDLTEVRTVDGKLYLLKDFFMNWLNGGTDEIL